MLSGACHSPTGYTMYRAAKLSSMCQNALCLEVLCVQNHEASSSQWCKTPSSPWRPMCTNKNLLSLAPAVWQNLLVEYLLMKQLCNCDKAKSNNFHSIKAVFISPLDAGFLSGARWSLLQSEHPQLWAVIEVMSYYHLSLAASGVILEVCSLNLMMEIKSKGATRILACTNC